eukprot:529399-Prymnesium_polylepis.1
MPSASGMAAATSVASTGSDLQVVLPMLSAFGVAPSLAAPLRGPYALHEAHVVRGELKHLQAEQQAEAPAFDRRESTVAQEKAQGVTRSAVTGRVGAAWRAPLGRGSLQNRPHLIGSEDQLLDGIVSDEGDAIGLCAEPGGRPESLVEEAREGDVVQLERCLVLELRRLRDARVVNQMRWRRRDDRERAAIVARLELALYHEHQRLAADGQRDE